MLRILAVGLLIIIIAVSGIWLALTIGEENENVVLNSRRQALKETIEDYQPALNKFGDALGKESDKLARMNVRPDDYWFQKYWQERRTNLDALYEKLWTIRRRFLESERKLVEQKNGQAALEAVEKDLEISLILFSDLDRALKEYRKKYKSVSHD
jgi:chromosome segregation ATPase